MKKIRSYDILFIHYYFPPIKSIASLRQYNLTLYLSQFFEKLFVISTNNNQVLPQDNFPTIEKIQLQTAYTFDYRTLIAWKNSLSKSQKEDLHLTEKSKSGFFGNMSVKLLRSFPFNLLIGEGGVFYILHAFYKGYRLIRKNDIQIIYSSFIPYSDHFIASWLKRVFAWQGRRIFWVADFRDLHIDPIYNHIYWESFQHWCNKRVLRNADLVTSVSIGIAQHLERYHSNVKVLRNGISNLTLRPIDTFNTNLYNPIFTLSYTGSLFGDYRNPTLLLEVIEELLQEKVFNPQNFNIRYAGKDTALWYQWLQDYPLTKQLFYSEGMVSLQQSIDIQRYSHVNLLLTSAKPEYGGVITGKFYEYLAARNPIIVLINGAKDAEFEGIMQEANAGILVYNRSDNSKEVLKSYLLMLFDDWYKHQKTTIIDAERLQNFTWEYTIRQFLEWIPS